MVDTSTRVVQREWVTGTSGRDVVCFGIPVLMALITSVAMTLCPMILNAYIQGLSMFDPSNGPALFHWTPFGGMWRGQPYGPHVAISLVLGQALLYVLLLWITTKLRGASQSRLMINLKWRFVHNVAMSVFSAGIVLACIVEIFRSTSSNEYFWCASVDTTRYELIQLVWVVSKAWEWVDTIFLLLQHKRPIALHLWHHASTMVFFAILSRYSGISKVGIICNGSIHVVMYAHYACPFPHWARRWITWFQIVQFCFGITYACMFTTCDYPFSRVEWMLGQFIVSTYLVLFVQFYRSTYFGSTPRSVLKPAIKPVI